VAALRKASPEDCELTAAALEEEGSAVIVDVVSDIGCVAAPTAAPLSKGGFKLASATPSLGPAEAFIATASLLAGRRLRNSVASGCGTAGGNSDNSPGKTTSPDTLGAAIVPGRAKYIIAASIDRPCDV